MLYIKQRFLSLPSHNVCAAVCCSSRSVHALLLTSACVNSASPAALPHFNSLYAYCRVVQCYLLHWLSNDRPNNVSGDRLGVRLSLGQAPTGSCREPGSGSEAQTHKKRSICWSNLAWDRLSALSALF